MVVYVMWIPLLTCPLGALHLVNWPDLSSMLAGMHLSSKICLMAIMREDWQVAPEIPPHALHHTIA